MLFDNNLLFFRSLCVQKLLVEGIHLSLERELFCGLALSSGCFCRFGHCLLFGKDNCLLFFGRICSGKSGIECSDFSKKGSIATGKSLLFSLYNGLLLLFSNSFLLSGCLCFCISSIEFVHFGLELHLLCGFCSGLGCRCLCGLCHSLLFGKDNCLLFFGRICGSESGIECCDLSSKCIVSGIIGNTLLLSLNNGLLLLFDNSLLLCGSLCSGQISIELVHIGLELSLLASLGSLLVGGRANHSLLFGTNNSILGLRSFCCLVSGIESSDLSIFVDISTAALLLSSDNSLLFSLDDSALFFLGASSLKSGSERIHFGLELSLLLGKGRSLLLCLEHSLLFGLDDSVLLLGRFCCGKSCIECKNFRLDIFGRRCLCHTLLLCFDNGLLLNVEDSFLFVLGLSSLQCGVERVHIRLELHLIFCLNVGLCGLEHSLLFGFDNSLLFGGGSCRLYSGVEFADFCINYAGSGRIGSEDLLFGFDNRLLFFGSTCSCQSGIECQDLGSDLFFLFFGSKSYAFSSANYAVISGSRSLEFLLFCNDFSLLFALDLSIDLSFCKSCLQVFFFLGSLSGIHSHLQSQNIGLNSCQFDSALVGLLLQLCSFLVSLLLFLDLCLHLLATVSGVSKAFTLVSIQNLFGSHSGIVCDHGSYNVGIDDELVVIFISKLGLNIDVHVHICLRFLISAHQHVLNTADDVGGVVDKVCNDLYRGKLFRRHGDHIHLALGGDGQKANGNYADTCSAATAKVFLSALTCRQIQATGCNTHGELGNRNNHHTARGNDLLTYDGVRINNRANLIQRIADYFLD